MPNFPTTGVKPLILLQTIRQQGLGIEQQSIPSNRSDYKIAKEKPQSLKSLRRFDGRVISGSPRPTAAEVTKNRLANQNQDKIRADRRQNLEDSFDTGENSLFDDIGTGLGVAGGFLSAASQGDGSAPPSVGGSAIGGALQGFASGGILGGLLGGVSGLNRGFESKADYVRKLRFEDQAALNRTVSIARDGGVVGEKGVEDLALQAEDLHAIQTEVGETILLEDLTIADVGATKKHEKMDEDEVTDILKMGSIILSDHKTFVPYDIKDQVIGYDKVIHTDGGKSSLNEITYGDIFGDSKKPMTIAQASKKLRDKISTHNDNYMNSDELDVLTNAENKLTRMPYIEKLVQLQSGKEKGKSKKAKVPKYRGGGVAGQDSLMSIYDELDNDFNYAEDEATAFANAERKRIGNLGKSLNRNNALGLVNDVFTTGLQSSRPADPVLENLGDIQNSFQGPSIASLNQISSAASSLSLNALAQATRQNPARTQQLLPRIISESVRAQNDAAVKGIYERANLNRQFNETARRADINNREKLSRYDDEFRQNNNQRLDALRNFNNRFLSTKSDINTRQSNALSEIGANEIDNMNDIRVQRREAGVGRVNSQLQLDDLNLRKEQQENAISEFGRNSSSKISDFNKDTEFQRQQALTNLNLLGIEDRDGNTYTGSDFESIFDKVSIGEDLTAEERSKLRLLESQNKRAYQGLLRKAQGL